jgi:hypothetical protein
MSHSRRKTPVFGHGTTDQDAWFRRRGVRALRHLCRQRLAVWADFDDLVLPEEGEVKGTEPWGWPSDGRNWMGNWVAGLSPAEQQRELSK